MTNAKAAVQFNAGDIVQYTAGELFVVETDVDCPRACIVGLLDDGQSYTLIVPATELTLVRKVDDVMIGDFVYSTDQTDRYGVIVDIDEKYAILTGGAFIKRGYMRRSASPLPAKHPLRVAQAMTQVRAMDEIQTGDVVWHNGAPRVVKHTVADSIVLASDNVRQETITSSKFVKHIARYNQLFVDDYVERGWMYYLMVKVSTDDVLATLENSLTFAMASLRRAPRGLSPEHPLMRVSSVQQCKDITTAPNIRAILDERDRLREALDQLLDDMRDGLCVSPAAKELAVAALKGGSKRAILQSASGIRVRRRKIDG